MTRALAPALLAALALAGCSLDRPYPDKALYSLGPSSGAPVDATASIPASVRVHRVTVAAPFGSRSIQYRIGEHRYEPHYYSAWADDPAEILTAAFTERLRASGALDAVLDATTAGDADATLDLRVERLCVDRTGPGRPVAALVATVTASTPDGEIVFSRTVDASTDAASPRAADAIAAWDAAIDRVVAMTVQAIRDAHASRSTPRT